MIRSFALTTSIILNGVVAVAVYLILLPRLQTAFAGNETWFVQVDGGHHRVVVVDAGFAGGRMVVGAVGPSPSDDTGLNPAQWRTRTDQPAR